MNLLFILIYSLVAGIPIAYYNIFPEKIREEKKGGSK